MYNGELVTAETVFGAEVTAVTLTASFGWDGTTVSTALEGEGTETNPYVLSSGANLAYLANSVNGGEAYSGKYFVLSKNINLNFKAWTPIGKAATTPFSGIINGNDNSITGINVEGDNYLGMFGVLYSATIKNITVDGTVVGNKDTVGILAGQIQSGTTIEKVIIRGRVTSKSSASTATGGVGGIAGNTVAKGDGAINIKDCINYAEINAPFTGSNMAGGIVGATNSQLIVIENCKNYGTINATGTFAGGIVGLFRVCKVDTKVTGCYNFGDINGNLQIGGIVGGNRYVVENCYVLATAKIKGTEAKDLTLDSNASPFVAAIAGRMEGTGAKRTGGGLCDAQGNVIE